MVIIDGMTSVWLNDGYPVVRGHSQLSTFMYSYRAYAGGGARCRRHSQERRVWKEDRCNQDWRGDTTGWGKKKDVFSGSDRGIQEELGDLCGRLHN